MEFFSPPMHSPSIGNARPQRWLLALAQLSLSGIVVVLAQFIRSVSMYTTVTLRSSRPVFFYSFASPGRMSESLCFAWLIFLLVH